MTRKTNITLPTITIEFDHAKSARLNKAYTKAVAEKKESFIFDGHTMVTNYAKYVLQYLDQQLERKE